MDRFEHRLRATAELVEAALERLLAERFAVGHLGTAAPDRLIEAVRHATLGAGKRFRPFLVIEAAALFGRADATVAQTGCAFECLHCYSLVHDDLPAMDDDDLRRGKPTVHKAFDEATAILVGDGLNTFAFELLSTLPAVSGETMAALVRVLAAAGGLDGMVGGQYRDLNAADCDTVEQVRLLQRMKTGALIRAACEAGAIVAGADGPDRQAMRDYGAAIGEAFQLADDLLDLEGTAEAVGKRTGKDAEQGKATVPGLIGVAETRRRLTLLVGEADHALARYGLAARHLAEAARFVATRSS